MDLSRARMKGQYKTAVGKPHKSLKYHMCESNTSTWYVSISNISGDDDEYVGGEYLVRIELPEGLPYSPPKFYFLTPQGLFDVDKAPCVSIGHLHEDDWRPALGVAGFCENLISALIGWRSIVDGIFIQTSNVDDKRRLAAASHTYNSTHHADILALIAGSYADYSSVWPR